MRGLVRSPETFRSVCILVCLPCVGAILRPALTIGANFEYCCDSSTHFKSRLYLLSKLLVAKDARERVRVAPLWRFALPMAASGLSLVQPDSTALLNSVASTVRVLASIQWVFACLSSSPSRVTVADAGVFVLSTPSARR